MSSFMDAATVDHARGHDRGHDRALSPIHGRAHDRPWSAMHAVMDARGHGRRP